jgi:branched-chain amino acid transport system permease protein
VTPRDLLPIAVVVGLLALVPLAVSANTVLNFLVFTLVIALAAQGWNLLAGYGGQFSFGHAAFFGTGAYATAILQVSLGLNPYLGFLVGIAAGALVGLAIGYLSFRSGLRGSYFALVTLAFAEVLRILANASAFTGGAAGKLIRLDVRPENFQFESRAVFYWIALALVAGVLVMTRAIERSRFGAHLVAVRENEAAARALGVDVLRVKLAAITLSAGVTAAAGCFYAQYFLYLDANIAYGAWISVEALLAPIIGGLGTVFGPLVGAVALHGLSEITKGYTGGLPGLDLVIFGVLLIVMVAFAPDGAMGLLRRLTGRFRRLKPAPRPAPEALP